MEPSTSIRALCENLDAHVDEVLREWLALASEKPWIELSHEERVDDVRALIRCILMTSLCAARDLEVHREKIDSACRHGAQRRSQGFDAPLLFAGYHFVREAVRRHLMRCGLDHGAATDALLRVDVSTTMATMASLRGYYRDEHEARGTWDDTLDAMARESLRLQPGR